MNSMGIDLKGGCPLAKLGGEDLYPDEFLKSSTLYSQHMAMKEEISKHKWYESERAGRDVGIDYAFVSWLLKHSNQWRSKG